MKKIITIVILFFSCLSFAQVKQIETVTVEKLSPVDNGFYIQKTGNKYVICEAETLKKNDFTSVEDYVNLNKNRVNQFTENSLHDLKLVLLGNFVWLHRSIVCLDRTMIRFKVSNQDAFPVNEPFSRVQVEKMFQEC